jgi:N-acetylneuraminic acid mutarotase
MHKNCPAGQRQWSALNPSFVRLARRLFFALGTSGLCFLPVATAQVPALINYQGRISVGTAAFEGTGQFKLAIVNADASQTYWRNAPDANNDGEPDAGVAVTVTRGLYTLMLGDTALANMAALPPNVFTNPAVYLRVWFDDGVGGFQLLAPDQRIVSGIHSISAATVSDGAITQEKLGLDLAAKLNSLPTVSADPQDSALTTLGYKVFMTVPAPAWMNGATTGAPFARSGHTAVWSGQELLIWGGDIGQGNPTSSGGAYQPSSDQWRALSLLNVPSARSGHSAVWTENEMIIWGGTTSGGYVNTGGRFDNASQNWFALPSTGAPTGRQGHVAAWTGGQMIIWGGLDAGGLLSDGFQFDPSANQWSPLSAANPPSARYAATAVRASDRLIVWGGQGTQGALNTGAQLIFSSGAPQSSWQSISASGAPGQRFGHTAIWTGQKMIVWGGRNGSAYFSDGAAYDPASDSWSALAGANAPSARSDHNAVWNGSEMIVLGGANASGALATGAAYDPVADKWRSLTNHGSPVARSGAGAVWSGTEVLVFGGQANGQPVAALQKLNPQPAWYFYRKP